MKGNIENKISNKNLLTPFFTTKTQNGITIEFTKEGMKVSGNSTSQFQYFKIFEGKLPVGNYVINGIEGSSYSSYIITVSKNGENIGSVGVNNFNFTLTEEATISLNFYPYLTDYSTPKIFNYQLEEGTTASGYVAHAEQNLPFTLEEGQKMYEDSYLADDGKHHKRKEYVLKSSDLTSLITLNNGNKAMVVYLPNKRRTSTNILLCDRSIFNRTFNENTFYENDANIVLVGNSEDTVETFQQKYTGATLEYAIENEEIIPYTPLQQTQYNAIKKAKSYGEKTYIESKSDDLPPLLKIQYYTKE